MINICQYKDLFGAPNTGSHKYRLFNIAVIDVIATLLLAYFISYQTQHPFWIIAILLILLSVIVHREFCVNTTLTKIVYTDMDLKK